MASILGIFIHEEQKEQKSAKTGQDYLTLLMIEVL